MTYEFVSLREAKKHSTYELTIRMVPGWLGRLFGAKEKEATFIGDGIFWHTTPNYLRAPWGLQKTLSEMFEGAMMNGALEKCK